MISLKIKSSLVPISNHPNRFSINLKRKNHTDNTLGKVFLLNSVRRLQKLSDLYIDGVRSYKNLASGENRGDITLTTLLFNLFYFLLLRLLQPVLFRIRDIPPNQIIISTYISNHPNRLSINLKKKKSHRQHIRQSVFIEFSSSITKIK